MSLTVKGWLRSLLVLLFFIPQFVAAEPFYTRHAPSPLLEHAREVIFDTYGDNVSINHKNKDLLKFGRSEVVGSSGHQTLMTLDTGETNETFVSTNIITHYASGSTSDTSKPGILEGHTCTGGVPTTFVTQAIAPAGQTKTALTTPLCRTNRAYNNSSTDWVGPLYFSTDVNYASGKPQTASAIKLIVPAGENQTFKAGTSLSAQDYWIVFGYYCDVIEKNAATADVRLEVRLPGKVFRPITGNLSCSNTQGGRRWFEPYIVVPPSSDIRLRAIASTTNVDVSGGITGLLAVVEDG